MDQPLVLTTKTLVALLLAVVILSGGVAVAAAQFSQPGSAGAQGRVKGETRELKKLNRGLIKANRTLTGIRGVLGSELDVGGSGVRRNTKETAENVQKLCRVIAEFASEC